MTIQNSWVQTVLEVEIGQTTLLKELCDYRRCVLREGKRSDLALFDFYSRLAEGSVGVQEARLRFPDQGVATHSLVISHKRRVAINRASQQLRFKQEQPAEYLALPAIDMECLNETQDMTLWQGVILVAVLPEKKNGIWNSQLLKITQVTPLSLVCLDTGKTYEVSPDFCQRYLRLSWALTYASLQGRTMSHSLRLLDLNHPRFTQKMLLVALSRARSSELVWLGE